MRFRTLVMLSAGTLVLAACGRDDAPVSNDPEVVAVDDLSTGNTLEPDNPLPENAEGFVKAAAASDRFEIESSKLAATAAQSAAVKSFAAEMIKAHTASTAKLKTAVDSFSPTIPMNDALNNEQQALLDGLKGKTGGEFDRAYAAAQVTAHEKTLEALKAYAAVGDNAALQQHAKVLVPTVTAHLNTAKGLR